MESRDAAEVEAELDWRHVEIEEAEAAGDGERRRVLRKELAEFRRSTRLRQLAEARQLLKERFDYPIFMYEAEKVGISATGEDDENELFPNDRQPADCVATCLELYRKFLDDPGAIAGFGNQAK